MQNTNSADTDQRIITLQYTYEEAQELAQLIDIARRNVSMEAVGITLHHYGKLMQAVQSSQLSPSSTDSRKPE